MVLSLCVWAVLVNQLAGKRDKHVDFDGPGDHGGPDDSESSESFERPEQFSFNIPFGRPDRHEEKGESIPLPLFVASRTGKLTISPISH